MIEPEFSEQCVLCLCYIDDLQIRRVEKAMDSPFIASYNASPCGRVSCHHSYLILTSQENEEIGVQGVNNYPCVDIALQWQILLLCT